MEKKVLKLSVLANDEIEAIRKYIESDINNEIRMKLGNTISADVYGVITEHYNSDDAISLIRKFTPFVYPANAVENLSLTMDTYNRSLFISFGKTYKERVRLFWSPLEMLLLRIKPIEVRKVYTYILGESEKLDTFNILMNIVLK